MSFDAYSANENESKSTGNTVDFNELNKYVVETAQLENREVLVGYVSSIVDLGTQEQQDAEVEFKGNAEDEEKEIAEKPQTYFKDGKDSQTGKPVRLKCWPQKPVQCVAVAVDFSDVILDKGKFFGQSKPLPLRLWLGGQFYLQDKGMVIGRPTPLKVNKSLGEWSFDKKHLFHKMAVASKLVKPDEVFLPKDIDKLLGKAFQFEAQVFFKESKGKSYYTEYVKFVGALGRGQAEPELLTTPTLIQFNKENDPDAIKELRAHVVNTMKSASNYEGSVVQKQIEELRGGSNNSQESNNSKEEKQTPKAAEEKPKKVFSDAPMDFDDDIPFAYLGLQYPSHAIHALY